MKVDSKLCVVVACLCTLLSSARALNLACDPNSEIGSNLDKLLSLLQESPSMNCTDQMLAIVQVTDFVGEAPTVFRALPVICESECLAYVHNVSMKCLPSQVERLGLACGKNEEQQFCYDTVQRDNGTRVQMQCFPERFIPNSVRTRQTATEQPATTNTSTTTATPPTCDDGCRRTLEIFRRLHGCCISNVFNSSVFGLLQFGLANYTLWSGCGVETVMANCSSPFAEEINPTMELTSSDTSFKVAAHCLLTVFALLVTIISR